MPNRRVGLRFRGSLLFAGVHSIVAFIAFFFSSVFPLGLSTFLGLDAFSGSAFFFSSASFFSAGVSSFSFILAALSSSVVTFSVFDVIVVSSSSSLSGRIYVSSSLVSSSVGHSGLSLSLWMFQLFLLLPYFLPRPFLTESFPSCSFLVGRLLCALFPLSSSPLFSCIGPQASTPLFFPVLRWSNLFLLQNPTD